MFNEITKEEAKRLDQEDDLKEFKKKFDFPVHTDESNALYFAGHSLGLRPKNAKDYVNAEMDSWAKYGVEGHFKGNHPWLPYHEFVTESLSKVVGAKTSEVVAMNTLTVNLHLMLVSFYRPTKKRFKILIENNTFPSDKYAVDSQARFHGFDPKEAIIELKPDQGEYSVRPEKIMEIIEENKDELALVMLGNCNYLSGQCFPMKEIASKAHEVGAFCGFNLAHGAGNLKLNLHGDEIDFAVWCSYKYLNSGPGGIAGAFVHEKHSSNKSQIPRFEGWWGHNKESRFKMGPDFDPILTVEAWQLSNPPIWQLASHRASLEIFMEAGMENIIKKRDKLTSYLEFLLTRKCAEKIKIMTPHFDEKSQNRGAMICVQIKNGAKETSDQLVSKGAIVDFREPDIIRIAPAPLYTSFENVFDLSEIIAKSLGS